MCWFLCRGTKIAAAAAVGLQLSACWAAVERARALRRNRGAQGKKEAHQEKCHPLQTTGGRGGGAAGDLKALVMISWMAVLSFSLLAASDDATAQQGTKKRQPGARFSI
jgi:hypothetical protein